MITITAHLSCDCPGCELFVQSDQCRSEAAAKQQVRLEAVELGWTFQASGPEQRQVRMLCPDCSKYYAYEGRFHASNLQASHTPTANPSVEPSTTPVAPMASGSPSFYPGVCNRQV